MVAKSLSLRSYSYVCARGEKVFQVKEKKTKKSYRRGEDKDGVVKEMGH